MFVALLLALLVLFKDLVSNSNSSRKFIFFLPTVPRLSMIVNQPGIETHLMWLIRLE